MKLRFEVELDARYVTIDVGRKAAELYGHYSETLSDEDFEALIEEVEDDIKDAIFISVVDAEIGR